jgi:hypothetical protein
MYARPLGATNPAGGGGITTFVGGPAMAVDMGEVGVACAEALGVPVAVGLVGVATVPTGIVTIGGVCGRG